MQEYNNGQSIVSTMKVESHTAECNNKLIKGFNQKIKKNKDQI